MPTTYRPGTTAAPKPAKDKSGLLMGGLITSAVIAVIAIAAALLFLTEKKGHLAARIGHEGMLRAIATMTGLPDPPTNGLLDVATAWAPAMAALSNQVANMATLETRVVELDERVATLEPFEQQAMAAQQELVKRGDDLKKAREDLAAANTASAQKLAAAQAELAAAREELAAAQAALAEAQAAATQAAPSDVAAADATVVATDGVTPMEATAAAAPTEAAVAPAEDVVLEPVVELTEEQKTVMAAIESGEFEVPAGTSEILRKLTYDNITGTLVVSLRGGQDLTYNEVPPEIYEGLLSAPVRDVFFRMRVLGMFACDTDDRRAIRAAASN